MALYENNQPEGVLIVVLITIEIPKRYFCTFYFANFDGLKVTIMKWLIPIYTILMLVAKGGGAKGHVPPFTLEGGHTFWDKKKKENKKFKEGNEKREENWRKIQFLLPILCVKDNFYFKLRKNWLLSDINHLGIFISILSCEIYIIFLVFRESYLFY